MTSLWHMGFQLGSLVVRSSDSQLIGREFERAMMLCGCE